MVSETSEEFVMDVLRVFSNDDIDRDALAWRTDGNYAPITFFVNCNDVFWWGTADGEKLTPENLPILKQSIVDSLAAYPDIGGCWAHELFVARVRSLRPQNLVIAKYHEALRPLFEAVGPPRESSLTNPGAAS